MTEDGSNNVLRARIRLLNGEFVGEIYNHTTEEIKESTKPKLTRFGAVMSLAVIAFDYGITEVDSIVVLGQDEEKGS